MPAEGSSCHAELQTGAQMPAEGGSSHAELQTGAQMLTVAHRNGRTDACRREQQPRRASNRRTDTHGHPSKRACRCLREVSGRPVQLPQADDPSSLYPTPCAERVRDLRHSIGNSVGENCGFSFVPRETAGGSRLSLAEFAANYHHFAGIPPSILPKELWHIASCFTKALYSPRKHRAPSIPLLLAKEAPNDGPAPPQNTKASFSLPRAAAFFFLFARKCTPLALPTSTTLISASANTFEPSAHLRVWRGVPREKI